MRLGPFTMALSQRRQQCSVRGMKNRALVRIGALVEVPRAPVRHISLAASTTAAECAQRPQSMVSSRYPATVTVARAIVTVTSRSRVVGSTVILLT